MILKGLHKRCQLPPENNQRNLSPFMLPRWLKSKLPQLQL
jgi:hypothetical protein